MLEWIVIIVAIAFIFGVIKVDMLKKQWNILQPKLKELLALGASWSKTKADEVRAFSKQKKLNDNQNNSADSDDKKA